MGHITRALVFVAVCYCVTLSYSLLLCYSALHSATVSLCCTLCCVTVIGLTCILHSADIFYNFLFNKCKAVGQVVIIDGVVVDKITGVCADVCEPDRIFLLSVVIKCLLVLMKDDSCSLTDSSACVDLLPPVVTLARQQLEFSAKWHADDLEVRAA